MRMPASNATIGCSSVALRVKVIACSPCLLVSSLKQLDYNNAVENFFSALTRRRLRRGAFRSIVALQAAINRYLDEHNRDPKPFVWTKPAREILAKLKRLPVPSV